MKRMTNMKKYTSRKKKSTAITIVAAIAIASSVAMTSVWQIPQATASSLEEIRASHEISAPIDQVWNVVSNVDNETKTHQFVTVNSEQFVVQTNITEGPVTGTRLLTLSPSSNSNATKIDVFWNVDLSGIPIFGR